MRIDGTVSGSQTGPAFGFGFKFLFWLWNSYKTWETGTESWTVPQLEVELALVLVLALALILG